MTSGNLTSDENPGHWHNGCLEP